MLGAQANASLQAHGEHATAKPREMVEQLLRKGDKDGANVWLRFIVAIGTLGEPPTRRGTSTAAAAHALVMWITFISF